MRTYEINPLTRSSFLVCCLLTLPSLPSAWAWDSTCSTADGRSCSRNDGLVTARSRWLGAGDEHRELWIRTRQAAGLPSALDEDIQLRVFTSGAAVGSYSTLQPTLIGPRREVIRRTSIAEMTQLPDFSYALWDWAMGNEVCPPDPSRGADECHRFAPQHMGLLNSSHFPPQSRSFYMHYHQLALDRADSCRRSTEQVRAEVDGDDARFTLYQNYLLACEKQALLLEAIGHHFLQDSWSMGHMWERWGGPEFSDFSVGTGEGLGAATALFAGMIHGAKVVMEALTGGAAVFDDPMCAPFDGVGYIDLADPVSGPMPAVGDLFLDLLISDPTYSHQRDRLLSCAASGARQVYERTAQLHGPLRIWPGGSTRNRPPLPRPASSCVRSVSRLDFVSRTLPCRLSWMLKTTTTGSSVVGAAVADDGAAVLALAMSITVLVPRRNRARCS